MHEVLAIAIKYEGLNSVLQYPLKSHAQSVSPELCLLDSQLRRNSKVSHSQVSL